MSSGFPNVDQEEIRALLDELAGIKEQIRETSRLLLRVERRIAVAFPAVAAAASLRAGARSPKKSHLDERSAQAMILTLKEGVSKGAQIEDQLKDYSVKPDLQMVARILGMTNARLPPKDELVRRISTRIRQSVSVTSGFQEDPVKFKSENEKGS